ncbi:glycosyltransferase family 2 protein [Phenylobacterium sp. LjRoot219]|uniref:glycosyltransferase family 2 protein n=1 Tax=Phenylobacterium sp. LjRoot219 TaxID=3342283 RepID=UPI003ED0A988
MNVLILAAGDPIDPNAADPYPIWLSEMEGGLVLERQVRALSFDKARFVFCFRRSDVERYHLKDIVGLMAPDCAVVEIRRDTRGAACTAMLAVGQMDLEAELIVVSATDHIDVDYAQVIEGFRKRGADAGVMTFESLHPRYSYVRTDAEGWVTEAAEKRPISRTANAGFFWFRRAGDFFEALQQMILKDAQVQERFFISPALNELILEQKRIATFALAANQYHPLKALSQVEAYEHALEARRA